jgi:hypothetical protein
MQRVAAPVGRVRDGNGLQGRALGLHHQTVQRCVERAMVEGPMAAIDDRPRPGREPSITLEAKAWLVSLHAGRRRTSAQDAWPLRVIRVESTPPQTCPHNPRKRLDCCSAAHWRASGQLRKSRRCEIAILPCSYVTLE